MSDDRKDLSAPSPADRLAGRAVLITGAAQGIGRAIARLFAAEGARLALVDVQAAELGEVAGETGAIALECDLRDTDRIGHIVDEAAQRLGHLDGLINAAGIHAAGSVSETTPTRWREVMAVNLDAPFFLCRAAEPHLRAVAGSTIVNLSSGTGLSPFPQRSAYATSKGALITLGKVLAMEFAPAIRVNTICPGLIDTPMTAALPNHNDLQNTLQRYALRRLGRDEEVAQAALFLTSTASSFITGTTMAVDGGRTYH
ncbi:SDR family oxidoreductase [Aquamicrobium sp. LC103]|uniref:SDR family NAD(P)-dependent oxidoreductase n=1 Tax=Aquamicrobium sp. LC103 TaxID=1120658 RepID=UPI00063E83A3|nr:SDR family oxidoreductase [Aquamicrobium sp. LC103]TKT69786.1 SDR family oxidoreductase [Aquamicrobium sp. LC103]